MSKLTALSVVEKNFPTKSDFLDLFSQLEEFDKFDLNMVELAANMSALLSHEDKSRNEICDLLGWSKGRMSYFLKGKTNPTLRSIFDFSAALGYLPDIIFRKKNEVRAFQPWQKKYHHAQMRISLKLSRATTTIPLMTMHSHDAGDIADAYIDGTHKPVYYSFDQKNINDAASIPTYEISNVRNTAIYNKPIFGSKNSLYIYSGVEI